MQLPALFFRLFPLCSAFLAGCVLAPVGPQCARYVERDNGHTVVNREVCLQGDQRLLQQVALMARNAPMPIRIEAPTQWVAPQSVRIVQGYVAQPVTRPPLQWICDHASRCGWR